MTNTRALFAATASVAALAMPFVAIAKGNPNGNANANRGDSMALALVDDVGTPGPSIGDLATFSVSTGADKSWVTVDCHQNGALVYTQTHGFFDGYPWFPGYTFGPTMAWTGGSASCDAELFTMSKTRHVTLASMSFDVAG